MAVILAAAAILSYLGWRYEKSGELSYSVPASPTVRAVQPITPDTPALDASTNRYENAAFHFSLAFPNTLAAREYKEENGALSVTFEDASSSQEFQIYVTPYAQEQITPERFKLDEPSGVRDDPTDIMIDGARATMFFSTNPAMGDTREVWFIHGGFLYEVVTEKENDAWLAGIMQTWTFI